MKQFLRALVVLISAAFSLSALPARAATVTVNTTTPNSSTDGKCGLTEAVQAVNQASTYRNCTYTANGQNDRIVVPTGTHVLPAGLNPTRRVLIVGAGQSSTFIEIVSSCAYCCLLCSGKQALELQNLTLRGNPAAAFGVMASGSPSSPLTFSTQSVRITGFAIGVSISGPEANVQITSSTIDTNGIGLSLSSVSFGLSSSTVRNNTAGGVKLYQSEPTYSSIFGSTIRDNRGEDGAGVYIDYFGTSSDPAILDIDESTFSANQATRDGGGLFARALVNVGSTVFDGNTAGACGGGVAYFEPDWASVNVEVDAATFKNNRATHGAGLCSSSLNTQGVKLTLLRSTFGPANIATGDGGGFYSTTQIDTAANLTIVNNQAARGGGFFHNGGESHIFHATITGNKATQSNGGGGFWLSCSQPIYESNIIAENTAGSGTTRNNMSLNSCTSLAAQYNLLDDVTGVSSFFPTSSSGGNNIVTTGSLGLGALGSHGGSTQVRPLLAGSPALDIIPPAFGDRVTVDQRGINRPIDGNLNGTASGDIGAVEMMVTPTLFEAESLSVAAKSSETLTTESNASYSGGMGSVLRANINGYVTYQTGTVQPGTYGVIVRYKRANNAGIFTLSVGSSATALSTLGTNRDGYAASPSWLAADMGTITVSSAGARYFRFSANSKNGSSSGYWTYIDSIQLYKLN